MIQSRYLPKSLLNRIVNIHCSDYICMLFIREYAVTLCNCNLSETMRELLCLYIRDKANVELRNFRPFDYYSFDLYRSIIDIVTSGVEPELQFAHIDDIYDMVKLLLENVLRYLIGDNAEILHINSVHRYRGGIICRILK